MFSKSVSVGINLTMSETLLWISSKSFSDIRPSLKSMTCTILSNKAAKFPLVSLDANDKIALTQI